MIPDTYRNAGSRVHIYCETCQNVRECREQQLQFHEGFRSQVHKCNFCGTTSKRYKVPRMFSVVEVLERASSIKFREDKGFTSKQEAIEHGKGIKNPDLHIRELAGRRPQTYREYKTVLM